MKNILLIGMLISMFLWGLSWPSAKVLSNYAHPINLSIYRYLIVILTLIPVFLYFKIPFKINPKAIPFFVTAGLLLAGYSYLLFKGLKIGTSGAGGVFVTTLNPISAYLIGIILSQKRPLKRETTGLILGLIAGCVLLKVWENADLLQTGGNLIFLLAAFMWASMSHLTARYKNFGSPLTFTFWMYVVTLIALLPFMDIADFEHSLQIRDVYFWGNIIFVGAIVTSLASTTYFYATSKLGSEKASSFVFLVPSSAAISSWFLLGEQLLWHTIVGGAIGILAVYLLNRK